MCAATTDMLHENREVNVKIPHEPSSFLKSVCARAMLFRQQLICCMRREEVNAKIPHEPSSFLKRVRESYVIPTTADMLREKRRSKRKNTT